MTRKARSRTAGLGVIDAAPVAVSQLVPFRAEEIFGMVDLELRQERVRIHGADAVVNVVHPDAREDLDVVPAAELDRELQGTGSLRDELRGDVARRAAVAAVDEIGEDLRHVAGMQEGPEALGVAVEEGVDMSARNGGDPDVEKGLGRDRLALRGLCETDLRDVGALLAEVQGVVAVVVVDDAAAAVGGLLAALPQGFQLRWRRLRRAGTVQQGKRRGGRGQCGQESTAGLFRAACAGLPVGGQESFLREESTRAKQTAATGIPVFRDSCLVKCRDS